MASPGTFNNPANPYRSIVGPTWAGGTNTNAIYALGNPLQAAQQKLQGAQAAAAGMAAPLPSNQQTYGQQPTPSYGFGSSGRGYGGGEGYGQGSPNYHSQVRIGNVPGTMSPPSPTVGGGAAGGLAGFYNMQRPGNGPLDNLNDQANLQNYFQNTPTQQHNYNRMLGPGAFLPPMAQGPVSQPIGGTTFNPDTGNWEKDITPRYRGGPVGRKPYLVGEKGPEIYASEDGDHEIVGAQGPEIRTFPKDGKIIPNDKVSKYMLNMRASGGTVTGDPNYPTFIPGPRTIGSFPTIRGRGMGQFPMIQARAAGGGVSGSPVNYGPPPMQYGQQTPISPYAMQYMPQAPVDPAYAAQAQVAQSDPNAPDSPWAMARYIRMGLQSAARQKLTRDAAYQAVSERKALQNLIGQGGSFTPQYPPQLPEGASVSYGPPGSVPHGMFTSPDISGAPGQFPMTAPQNDPNATTFTMMDQLNQLHPVTKGHPNPLMELLGRAG